MHSSGDVTLCLVRYWASISHRILAYPGTNTDSASNTIFLNRKLKTITSSTVHKKLRSAAKLLGKDHLGFHSNNIVTHSIRSGSAMSMYLD